MHDTTIDSRTRSESLQFQNLDDFDFRTITARSETEII